MSKFVRFRTSSNIDSRILHGLLEDGSIAEIAGDPLQDAASPARTGRQWKLAEVQLLHPCVPGKVLAVGRNFKSHLGTRAMPVKPEIFYKPISCLQHPDGPIVYPLDATDVHYEGEMVLVIGKRLKRASEQEALAGIFGVTCGNDVTERQWQHGPQKDNQWWRGKGCDTFGPFGPAIVTGLDYDRLQLRTRLNGEVVQDQSTADFIFDCGTFLSFISRYVTLEPGDIVYTGTPQATRPMKPGDTVEVEIEGVGVLRNPVVANA